MTTDDELLAHVHREARRRIRRRRLAVSAASVILVVGGISAAAVAFDGESDVHHVVTTNPQDETTLPPSTTAPPVTSITTAPPATTTTAPAPVETTTSTAPPTTTTTLPPIAPVTVTRQVGGLRVVVTATQDRSRPGHVDLRVTMLDGHGSIPTGSTTWGPGSIGEAFGDAADYMGSECDDVMDDDPTTNLEPDRNAGDVDRTFTLSHDYGTITGDITISTFAITSICTTDEEHLSIDIVVPLGG
jgi:hypothetical protein